MSSLTKPTRGVFLTGILLLLVVVTTASIAGHLLTLSALKKLASSDPEINVAALKKLALILLGVQVLELTSAVGMWLWRRWAVFAFAGLCVMQLVITLKLDPTHPRAAYSPFVWLMLVVAAVLPRWRQFFD